MSGWKQWAIGEVVEADDFQTYVQDQVVQTYADSDARGSALGTAVSEGMMAFTADDKNLSVYSNSNWNTVSQAISPNYIINGAFDIWQRGTSANTNLSYAADRWLVQTAGSGMTFSTNQEAFTAGDIEAIGFGDAQYFYRITCTTAGSGLVLSIRNRIEDARTLAGQTVTLSFWARSDSSRTFVPRLDRTHGTGGSGTIFISFAAVTVGSTWQRYSVSVAIPSLSGLTVGANSYLQLVFPAEIADGSVLDLWGVQLEAGSVATPFRRNANSIQGELAACQRYYWRWTQEANRPIGAGIATSTTNGHSAVFYPVTMRATPTLIEFSNVQFTDYATYAVDATAVVINVASENSARIVATVASGLTQFRPGFLITKAGGHFALGAEL